MLSAHCLVSNKSRCSLLKTNKKSEFCCCCSCSLFIIFHKDSGFPVKKHLISHFFMPWFFVINLRLNHTKSASAHILYSSSGVHIQQHKAAYKYWNTDKFPLLFPYTHTPPHGAGEMIPPCLSAENPPSCKRQPTDGAFDRVSAPPASHDWYQPVRCLARGAWEVEYLLWLIRGESAQLNHRLKVCPFWC